MIEKHINSVHHRNNQVVIMSKIITLCVLALAACAIGKKMDHFITFVLRVIYYYIAVVEKLYGIEW